MTMTIEEKAKRYDEALERMKSWVRGEHPECFTEAPKAAEFIFPELKESEDERIRKTLKEYFINSFQNNGVAAICGMHIKDILAWLEKQGKNNMSISEATKQELEDNLNKALEKETPESCNEFLEKQGEQKPADKVEPKFKIGDWITDGYLHCKISDVLEDRYIVDTKFGKRSAIPFKRENNYHLWSIQDAKDGDILIYNDSIFIFDEIYENDLIYYGIYEHNKFHNDKYYSFLDLNTININNIYPATKEQRDTFERAMADAGYAFDFDKKELKKIEKPIEWSYEDEANLNNIIWLCNNCIKGSETTWIPSQATKIKHLIETIKEKGLAQQNPAWSEEDEQITLSIEQAMNCASLLNVVPEKIDIIRTWLKSLKQRIGG